MVDGASGYAWPVLLFAVSNSLSFADRLAPPGGRYASRRFAETKPETRIAVNANTNFVCPSDKTFPRGVRRGRILCAKNAIRGLLTFALAGRIEAQSTRSLQLKALPWEKDSWLSAARFEDISAVAVDEKNRVFVLDRRAMQITTGSSERPGRAVTIARGGAGPQEFGSATTHLVASGGIVFVPDPSNARILRLLVNGGSLRSLRYSPRGLPIAFAADGRGGLASVLWPTRAGKAGSGFSTTLLLTAHSDSALADASTLEIGLGDSSYVPRMLDARPVGAATATGFVLGSGSRKELRQFNFDGSRSRLITLRVSDAPILRRADARSVLAQALGDRPLKDRLSGADMLIERRGHADRYPLFVRVITASNARIFLELPVSAKDLLSSSVPTFTLDDPGSNRWLLLSGDGQIIGSLTLKKTERLLWANESEVILSSENADGELQLLRFSIS
jgi:hypothetical protein